MKFAGKKDMKTIYEWLNPEGMTIDEQYDRNRLLAEFVEVDEGVWDYFLGVLPPIYFSGGFAICEGTTQDLRLGFFHVGERAFAAYVSDYDKARLPAATGALIAAALAGVTA